MGTAYRRALVICFVGQAVRMGESEESGAVGGWTGILSLAWLLGKGSNDTQRKTHY